jgi:hypothetical protein
MKFFSELVTLFLANMNCLWKKMVGFVSDGASAMIGKSNAVAAKLKKKNERIRGKRLISVVPTVFFIKKHCVQKV